MKIAKFFKLTLILIASTLVTSCDYVERMASESRNSLYYEKVALKVAQDNRLLKSEINKLRYEVETLKAKNNYLSIKLKEKEGLKQQRAIASLKKDLPSQDLVKYEVYNWTPDQVLSIAHKEFQKKNYEKAAQFFNTFATQFPNHNKKDDLFLLQAGVAAYESGNHEKWVQKYLGKLVQSYPTSPYYRSAKLWLGLSHLKTRDHQAFFKIVEEFRKKYRNTDEWKILSAHYEEIVQKYKQ